MFKVKNQLSLLTGFCIFTIALQSVCLAIPAEIVIVGDSHTVGFFGRELENQIRKLNSPSTNKPASVFSISTVGSSAASWLSPQGTSKRKGSRICDTGNKCVITEAQKEDIENSPSFEQVLTDSGPKPFPKVAIIALGSNMLVTEAPSRKNPKPKTYDDTMTEVSKMIQTAKRKTSQCIWIGPPQPHEKVISPEKYGQFVSLLKATVLKNDCQYISSHEKTDKSVLNNQFPKNSGLHYDYKSSVLWANGVFKEISPLISSGLTNKTAAAASQNATP